MNPIVLAAFIAQAVTPIPPSATPPRRVSAETWAGIVSRQFVYVPQYDGPYVYSTGPWTPDDDAPPRTYAYYNDVAWSSGALPLWPGGWAPGWRPGAGGRGPGARAGAGWGPGNPKAGQGRPFPGDPWCLPGRAGFAGRGAGQSQQTRPWGAERPRTGFSVPAGGRGAGSGARGPGAGPGRAGDENRQR
jgi:hypothetical protein